MKKHAGFAALACAALTCGLSARYARAEQAAAPAPSDDIMETIVVTAQKRTEKLQDVPIAITVVGSEQLQDQHVYSVADLARTSPSLEMIQAFGGPGGGGQIRGVGTQSFTRSAEGAVGIVVDGVPQGNVPNSAIFDIARVEVLRGPQGTLFGLTSSAGVINMVTTAPDFTKVSGYAHIDYANGGLLGSEFGQQTVKAALNLPVSATSALRISVNGNRVAGVERNAATGEGNLLKDGAVRARYLWDVTDAVTVNLIADYDKRTQNYGDPQFVYVNVPAGSQLATQLAACGIVASYANNERCSNMAANTDTKNYGFSGQIDWALSAGTVTNIVGWRRQGQLPSSVDIMGNPQDFFQIFIKNQVNAGRQLTEELRFASSSGQALEYVAGLFYSDYKASTGYADVSPTSLSGFNVGTYQRAPFFIPFVSDTRATETSVKSDAVFGQATYHIDSQFAVLAGIRFTHEKLSDFQAGVAAIPAGPTSGPIPAVPANIGGTSESNVSGKVGLQYKASESLNTYATITKGYKGPQVVPAAEGNPAQIIGAEKPMAYEVGAKGSALDGRLGYDLGLFYTKVQDYQGQRCTINPVGVLTCNGESIPSVTTKGIELETFGHPLAGLMLNAGIIYDVAKFPGDWTGYNPNDLRPQQPGTLIGQTSLGGLQLVGVPKTKFTFSGDYSHALGSIEGFVGADAVYKSAERLAYSGDDRFVYGAHWTVGAHFGVRADDRRWSVEMYGRNLGNEHEPATLFGGPSFIPPGPVPFAPNGQVNGISGWTVPTSLRQVGITAEVRF